MKSAIIEDDQLGLLDSRQTLRKQHKFYLELLAFINMFHRYEEDSIICYHNQYYENKIQLVSCKPNASQRKAKNTYNSERLLKVCSGNKVKLGYDVH